MASSAGLRRRGASPARAAETESELVDTAGTEINGNSNPPVDSTAPPQQAEAAAASIGGGLEQRGFMCCAVLLTLAAFASRLWRLDLPATPVYDETHVGRFIVWCPRLPHFSSPQLIPASPTFQAHSS